MTAIITLIQDSESTSKVHVTCHLKIDTYNSVSLCQIIEIQIHDSICVKFSNGTINIFAKDFFDFNFDKFDPFSSQIVGGSFDFGIDILQISRNSLCDNLCIFFNFISTFKKN